MDMTTQTKPRSRPELRPRVVRLLAITGTLVLAGAGVITWQLARKPAGPRGSQTPSSAAQPAAPKAGVRVEVVRPSPAKVGRTMSQPGTIEAFDSAELYAKISGYLKQQRVDIGDRVKAGDVLAELDVPEAVDAVNQAVAALEQANATVAQSEARIKVSQAEWKAALAQVSQTKSEAEKATATVAYRKGELARIEGLNRLNAVPAELVDEEKQKYAEAVAAERSAQDGILTASALASSAEAKAQLAEADLAKARADVRAATANLARARDLLQYTTIRSPYDGIVTHRSFHPGDFILSATEGGTVPLLAVAKVDVMRVVVHVPDRDVPFVDPGDPALVRVDALGGRVFAGTVARFAGIESEEDRSMRTEIDLPNPDGMLRSGMFGNVTITLEAPSGNLVVPSACLIERADDGRGAVFVVRDGKVHRCAVHTGKDDGITAEILKGVGPDDHVVLRYTGALAEGVAVRAEPAAPNHVGPD